MKDVFLHHVGIILHDILNRLRKLSKIFKNFNVYGQGLENLSWTILEDKDFPQEQQC